MKDHRGLSVLGVLSLLLAGDAGAATSDAAVRPNIVFIMADDLGAGWVDYDGSDPKIHTPNLERLARNGMVFDRAYAAAPVCSPTRAACITGMSPARLHLTTHIPGIAGRRHPPLPGGPVDAASMNHLPAGVPSFARELKKLGYATAFMGKWHLAGEGSVNTPDGIVDRRYHPEHYGFDINLGGCAYGQPRSWFDPYKNGTIPDRKKGQYLTDRLGDEAAAYIRSQKGGPFLLTLWFYSVHTPIRAPKALVAKNGGNAYLAMIACMDNAVGKVLAALDETGARDNTLVVFYSDNGGDRPTEWLAEKKGSLLEGGLRVPMVVSWPGVIEGGTRCDVPVTSMDFFPTFVHAAGGSTAGIEQLEGVDLMPLFRGAATLKRDALFWHYPHNRKGIKYAMGSAILSGDWKLYHGYGVVGDALFNLEKDPLETTNQISRHPELAKRLRERLARWLRRVDAEMPPAVTRRQTSRADRVLRYDHPIAESLKRLDDPTRRSPASARFMREALPLGNGRFGAMFSGHVDVEYLVFNDITLWMNSTRGESAFKQSGSPPDGKDHLALVRAACREEKFGSGEGSIESLGTKYLATKQRLGNFAPFADLEIRTGQDPSAARDYQRALDLATGVASVRYRIGDVRYSREYFCSHPQDLFVARFTAEGGKMDLVLQARTVHPRHTIEAAGREIRLRGFAAMDRDDMAFMQRVRVDAGDATVAAKTDGTLHISGATDVVIYVAGYTDYLPNYPTFKGRDFEGDTLDALERAEALGYAALKRNHVADVRSLMGRVTLDLGAAPSQRPADRLIEEGPSRELEGLFFDYARYLAISSSRDAPVPSNLQGLWNTLLTPPWNSDYHNDINVQMNYWLVETTNLAESFTPFLEWTRVLAESGRHTAWGTFGVEQGWSVGVNGNIFGFTAQNEHGRRMQQGGHWLTQHLFEHYAFDPNRAYLEEVYPILKGAAEFFVSYLAPWKDGTLVVYPTWSPENYFLGTRYGKLNKQGWGASFDQQLLVELFTNCIEASLVLNRDAAFRQTLRELIPKLCPQKINAQGYLQEWPDDWDDYERTHRHLSHLIALHPGRDFSPLTTPKLARACEAVLRVRVNRGEWKGAWRSACWARLRNGDEALRYYQDLFSQRANPNLLNGRRFQIDGNLGAGAAVPEMLLQSHLRSVDATAKTVAEAAFVAYREDPRRPNHFVAVVPPDSLADAPYILDLLPALPSAWPEGRVRGLRARGGFDVDITWKDGKLVQATVHARRDGSFRIHYQGTLSEVISLQKGQSFSWPR